MAAHLLRLWVQNPLGTWMSVCCECCVLPGRGLRNASITRPEESYQLWCIIVCDIETSRMRRPWAAAPQEKKKCTFKKIPSKSWLDIFSLLLYSLNVETFQTLPLVVLNKLFPWWWYIWSNVRNLFIKTDS